MDLQLNIKEDNLISSVGLLDDISAERISNKDLLPGKGYDQIEGLVRMILRLNILEAAGSLLRNDLWFKSPTIS